MNREIKFRAWTGKSMLYNVGFHPYMSINLITSQVAESEELSHDDEKMIYSPGIAEIMQYTGLKDKHGKEVYEGDVLKHDDNDLSGWKGIVYYDDGAFKINPNGGVYSLSKDRMRKVSIVGNIYESPEFNKEEQ